MNGSRSGIGIGICIGVGICFGAGVASASQITSIDFKNAPGASQIEIKADGPVSFEKQENAQDKQVVLELKGAKLSKSASRKLDTSSFNSPVSLISPYAVEGQADDSRIVIQLKESAAADVSQDGNVIRIRLPNGAQAEAAPPPPPQAPPSNEAAPADAAPPPPAQELAPSAESAPNGALDQIAQSQATRTFSGRPVTLQLRDSDLSDVFRLIGEASGFNIILGDDVKGKITLSLVDTPWDQALDVVLRTQHLGAERSGNVLRIVTLKNLTEEKTQELQAKIAAESAAPRVTRTFSINYANLDELTTTISKFAGSTSTGASATGGAGAGQSAFVTSDRRTNQLIVRDIPDNLERIKKLIAELDTQTPQVMITAKVIEAKESFSRDINGNLGLGTAGANGPGFASFNGATPLNPLLGSVGSFTDLTGITSASGKGTMGYHPPGISLFGNEFKLNALLTMGESEQKIKLISSPKVVVLNKETAKIVQSFPVINTSTVIANGSQTITQNISQANLSLEAVPTVTNEGAVLMNLNLSRDVPEATQDGTFAVSNRNLTTRVLVDSGTTLVIGGIYTLDKQDISSGFPILRKIPIIGWFFGNETKSDSRNELFFFITPRILNPKEAGLAG